MQAAVAPVAHALQRKLSHQQFHPGHLAQQPSTSSSSVASSDHGASAAPAASYNGQGSIATMQELYEVGEVIGTGTFGIIRKVRLACRVQARLGLISSTIGDTAHRWTGGSHLIVVLLHHAYLVFSPSPLLRPQVLARKVSQQSRVAQHRRHRRGGRTRLICSLLPPSTGTRLWQDGRARPQATQRRSQHSSKSRAQ